MTMVNPAAHQNLPTKHHHHHHHHKEEKEEEEGEGDIIFHQLITTPGSFGSHMSPFEGCYYNNYGRRHRRRLCNLESDPVAVVKHHRHHHQQQQHMAEEDESRTTTSSSFNDKTRSSSKDLFHDEQTDHESWLQLRIGNNNTSGGGGGNNNDEKFDTTATTTPPLPQRGGGLVELDLLPTTPPPPPPPILPPPPPPRSPIFHLPPMQFQSQPQRHVAGFMSGGNTTTSSASGASSSASPWLFLQQQQQFQGSSSSNNPYFLQQDNNSWAFIRPAMNMNMTHHHQNYHQNYNIPFGIGSFSTSRPPHHHHHHHQMQQAAGIGMMDVRRPSGGVIRVVDTPRRPHSGVWFVLQASPTQSKEPFLPQISKRYLRIKDGRMTVGLLMKYLVNKLTLDNESEVEITCRGQQLQPFLTLQHVRDNIWWSQRDAITLLPDSSSTTDHLMVLQYGRTTTA